MANLAALNVKRGQVKGQLTRFKTFIETSTEANRAQITDRLKKAETLFAKYEEVQEIIEAENRKLATDGDGNVDETEIQRMEEEFEEERQEFEDAYYDIIQKARTKLPQPSNRVTDPANTPGVPQSDEVTNTNVKLPVLTLPTFNGNYNQWLLFKDSFTSLIHLNTKLNNIQKFQYLRSALKDEALQILQSLETSAENYAIGWSLLTQRYENKRLIINTHMKELFELTQIPKSNLSSLRQFIDTIQTHIRALESLGQPVESWDTILIHLLSNRLDFWTRRDWEIHIGNKEDQTLPTMKQWLEFLTGRCHTLELVEGTSSKQTNARPTNAKKETRVSLATTSSPHCTYCEGEHYIHQCEEFTRLPVHLRQSKAKEKQLCINCLRKGHYAKDCRGSSCRKCSKQHNTLLHQEQGTYSSNKTEREDRQDSTSSKKTREGEAGINSSVTALCSSEQSEAKEQATGSQPLVDEVSVIAYAQKSKSQVILSTAQVNIFDSRGYPIKCRALLDPGSQSNLITKSLVNKLNLQCKGVNIPISGVSQSKSNIKEAVQIKLISIHNSYQAQLECLVLDTITEPLPQSQINTQALNIPKDIRLADPKYDKPGPIDLLIGASIFWQLLCVGRAELGRNQPILQKTLLGWVLGGEMKTEMQPTAVTACCLTLSREADEQLEKFWRIEEILIKSYPTKEEKKCEQHYIDSVQRAPDGRFILRLPTDPTIKLGDSRRGALRRFYTTERKLQEEPKQGEEYQRFLSEYEALGHMTPVEEIPNPDTQQVYYLPHQPVVNTTSLTTKLRVVFDGSAKTSIGTSLNDKLLTGPNLQEDIMNIVLRFRCHQYVLTADVAMMFRQILIAKEDRDLQRILWRPDPNQAVQEYTLNTVTYGTSCAPYLAMRCLKQLAIEAEIDLPQASRALLEDCYMDDILTGCETFAEALKLQRQLYELLARGKFPLRKWRCNDAAVLEPLAEESCTQELLILDAGETRKTLGLLWNAAEDNLQYSIDIQGRSKPTKRSILSRIAKIYDPLGLLGPITIIAKMIMQELWKLQLSWDESIPQSLYTTWCTYYCSLPRINELKIPRNINPDNYTQKIDLQGFSDASEKGYGACVYCTYENSKGGVSAQLLCSKSRVAPLKSMSIPRLELNAALILARLIDVIRKALGDTVRSTTLWSDSTIILSWVKTPPHTLKTFVANRVAEIQELTPDTPWFHVPTADNPADLLSRGIPVSALIDNQLWWYGPHWLPNPEEWPEQSTDYDEETTERKTVVMVAAYTPPDVLHKYSKYSKLQRVIAYCFRFINNTKGSSDAGPLTVNELENADNIIVKMIQKERFQPEIQQLNQSKTLANNSCLITLKPFLDGNGLIRVGGRLRNANIPEGQRHPIVLPSKHFVTTLIMRQEHYRLMHGGPELLLNSIRQQYWPLSGRREARKITRNCLQCFRYHPAPMKTVMADLPKSRLHEVSRPFVRCGIDYAGPFLIRENKRRGRVPMRKAYVAIFVCFSTKALHIELVSSLTSEAFLAALRRFVARRGTPSHIYSDNATNFVGANRELSELYEFLEQQKKEITTTLATQKITWHFIPPRSPHFGGLWEAAVKSVKKHINITMRGLTYTYEEYNTLLIEVEAILNSRPLIPMSSDPNDMSALTPSHFLIGDLLLQPAASNYQDVPTNRLSIWEHLQTLRQHFWKRWRHEYLNQLQARTKWTKGEANLRIGSLVLMIDDNSPPLHWPMGRVVEVHPGEDEVVRVVTVRTPHGTYKRAVKKLCVVPQDI